MHPDGPFTALLVITLLALLVPVLVSRLPGIRLPIVVGEILAGIVVGRSGLQLIAPSATLQFLQEFGFVFLMFLSGLELDVQALFLPHHQVEGVHFGQGAFARHPQQYYERQICQNTDNGCPHQSRPALKEHLPKIEFHAEKLLIMPT